MLELNRVSAGYGKQTVLNDVSAFFEKGKFKSIIGVNGCGKSTLLKTILGILPLSGGKITVDGENLLTMSRNDIAKKIAYLSQGKNTPDMTVMQMVLHGRFPYLSYPRKYTSRDREIAYSAMEQVGIADFAENICKNEKNSLLSGHLSGHWRICATGVCAHCRESAFKAGVCRLSLRHLPALGNLQHLRARGVVHAECGHQPR